MKTATFPAVRVEQELREAAESILSDGESLSAFVEQSIRANIERRLLRSNFIARALASRDSASQSGPYVSADDVLCTLEARLAGAKTRRATARDLRGSGHHRGRSGPRPTVRLHPRTRRHRFHTRRGGHSGASRRLGSPFTCRKARSDAPFLQKLIIPFGRSGYVGLFEIEDSETVTVLTIRHQLEDDYH
jgi:hypothetical protein